MLSFSSSNKENIVVKPTIIKGFHRPHFRLVSLTVYLAFIVIFNLIIAPTFGVGTPVYASVNIDTNRLVDLANQDRADNGIAPVAIDQRLVNAATNKAIDMFKKQYWAHYGPNGETPWQFIVDAGYNYSYAGENLAKDFTDTDSINTAWMNSSSHKANILNTNYKNIGIAAVSGKQICNGTYPDFTDNTLSTCSDTVIVVQMFGSPAGSSTSSTSSSSSKTLSKTVTPTTAVPQAPRAPLITSPENNSNINTSKINIHGNADNNTSVSVFEGGKKIGTVTTSDGSFDIKDADFSDGQHKITATTQSLLNNLESSPSSEVTFNIDTQKPVFKTEDVRIQLNDKNDSSYYIEGTFPVDTISAKAVAGVNSVDLIKDPDTNFFHGIIKVPTGNVGVVLSAYDSAGNFYTQEIKLPQIPLTNNNGLISTAAQTTYDLNTRQIINIIVGILVLLVFVADSILVWRAGRHISKEDLMLHRKIIKNEKGSFLHHVIPVVIILISISATFSGKVL